MENLIKLSDNKTIKIAFLLFSLSYSFSSIFFGLDFTDTFYWINLIPNYSDSPMCSGTLYIGGLWTQIFGNQLFVYRIFAWLLEITALLTPFFLLLPRKARFQYLNILSISIILFRNTIFSPDILTVLIFSLIATFIILYFNENKVVYIIIIAFLSGVSLFIRFPNIAFVFVFVFCIPFLHSRIKGDIFEILKIYILYFIVLFTTIYLLSIVFFRGFVCYLGKLCNELLLISQNKTYASGGLIENIIRDFWQVLLFSITIYFFCFLINIFSKTKNVIRYMLLIMTYVVFTFLIYKYIYKIDYNWNQWLLYSAIYIVVIGYSIVSNLNNLIAKRLLVLLCLTVAIAFASCAGSNTGLLKFSPLLVCFYPVIAFESRLEFKPLFKYSPFAIVVILCVMFNYMRPYEDKNIVHLNSVFSAISDLKYIHTSPERGKYIDEVLDDYHRVNRKENVVFFGGKSHVFYYLTGLKPLYKQSFWMNPDDEYEVLKIDSLASKKPLLIFLLDKYPSENVTDLYVSRLENMLLLKGYKAKFRYNYKIYSCQAKISAKQSN